MPQEKSGPDGFYTVAQVARQTGLAASTIRYYDQQFEEYLALRRGPGRRRLFDDGAVERLQTVRELLKERGLSLRQARQSLGGEGMANAPSEKLRALEERVAVLEGHVRDLKQIQTRTLALVDLLTKDRR